MLTAEKEHLPVIEAILAKKAENRPVTPEEYSMLILFVDRVEKRTIERQKAEAAVEEERLLEARKGIPDAAFEMELSTLDLREHISAILTEAKFRTVGDLMLAIKLNPDTILGLPGIGPKAMQAIETALASVAFPVTELPVEIVEPELEQIPEPETVPTDVVPESEIPTDIVSEQPVAVLEETPPPGKLKRKKAKRTSKNSSPCKMSSPRL